METWNEIVKPIGSMFIGIVIFMWALTWSMYKWDVCVSEANIVDVYVGQRKVYEGKQAFIKVESGGMTTHLTIFKNLYPTIVDRLYSSSDINIVPVRQST